MNLKRRAASLLLGVLLAGCGSTPLPTPSGSSPPAPSWTPVVTPSGTVAPPPTEAAAIATPWPTPGSAPTPSPIPTPSAASLPTPSPAPTLGPITAASLPVRSNGDRVEIILDPTGVPYAMVWSSPYVIAALDDEGRPAPGWPVAIPNTGWSMAPVFAADGTLYILLGSEQGIALTALRRDGTVAAGWPVYLGDLGCNDPLPLADGTIRIACNLAPDAAHVYAFDRWGRALSGWPVDVPGLDAYTVWVALDTTLVGLQGGPGWVRRFTIDANGTVRLGTQVTAPVHTSSCYAAMAASPGYYLGPDGTAYMWSHEMSAPGEGPDGCRFLSSTFTVFDEQGVRAGWPVTVSGETSGPVLGPDGRIYVTQGTQRRRPTRIFAFDAGGRRVAGWPVRIDVAPTIGMGGAGWGPPASVRVGADGTVYLVTEDRGTTIYALSPDGKMRPGWPYRSTSGLGDYASPCATGGGHPVIDPIIDTAGRLHLVNAGSPLPYGFESGSHVTLVDDGRASPGWPVTLSRAGSRFVALRVDAAGVTYALASEYEGPERCDTPQSATLLAIGRDGKVLFRTTLVEP